MQRDLRPIIGAGAVGLPQNQKSPITKAFERYFKTKDINNLVVFLHRQGIDTIVFDMDGTLIDSEGANIRIVEEGLKEHGVTISAQEKEDYIGTTIKGFCEKILKERKIADAESKALAISDSKKVKFPQMLERNEIDAFDKVIDLIKKLQGQGFKFALVTNSQREIMEKVLEHFKLRNYFQLSYGREDADGKSKPNPYVYNKTMRQLNSKPKSTLIFEDSATGIKAADDSGAQVIAIKNLPDQNPQGIHDNERIHRLDMTQFA